MARVLCRECGHANPRLARFCAACGRSSPAIGSKDPSLVPAASGDRARASEQDKQTLPEQTMAALRTLPPGAGMLLITGGATVRGYRLEAEVMTAGRHPGSDIVLEDPSVSRQHAEFRRHGETYIVRDLGGLNGTYVNHERVEEAALVSRDELRLGKYHLVFLAS